ncbi:hypothetical protein P5F25_02530 [Clostridium perfringens]|nr:hypothetical protein [Clostridium perfringens]
MRKDKFMVKDEIKEVEDLLKNYNDMINIIELKELEIKDLEETYCGCEAISYSERSGQTYKFNSSVENEVVDREKRINKLKRELKESITIKRKIEKAVESLNGVDRKVIELRYINKRRLGWKQIASVVNYCEEHCRKRIKTRAISKMIKYILY